MFASLYPSIVDSYALSRPSGASFGGEHWRLTDPGHSSSARRSGMLHGLARYSWEALCLEASSGGAGIRPWYAGQQV